jgi:hypothetical protein
MKEYKDIQDYIGLYQISESGIIISLERTERLIDGRVRHRKQRMLNPFKDANGYLSIKLHDRNGNRKNHYIAVLVAKTFIGEIEKGKVVNHKDFDPLNNHYTNLEITTQARNIQYSREKGRYDDQKKKVKIEKEGKVLHFDSAKDCMSFLNVKSERGFFEVLSGKRKSVYGFKASYA